MVRNQATNDAKNSEIFSNIPFGASSSFSQTTEISITEKSPSALIVSMLVLPIFMGVNGVWLALPVAEILALILSIILIAKNARRYSLI